MASGTKIYNYCYIDQDGEHHGYTLDPDWRPVDYTDFYYTDVSPMPEPVSPTMTTFDQNAVRAFGEPIVEHGAWSSGDPIVESITVELDENRWIDFAELVTDGGHNAIIQVCVGVCTLIDGSEVVLINPTKSWNFPPGQKHGRLEINTLFIRDRADLPNPCYIRFAVTSTSTTAFKWGFNIKTEIRDPLAIQERV
jgi:hypothetical protein